MNFDTRLIHKAKQIMELDANGASTLSDIVNILMEVHQWGLLDAKLPAWGDEVDAIQIGSSESKVRGVSKPR